MGNDQSSSSKSNSQQHSPSSHQPRAEYHGWRILNVLPQSPSSNQHVIPYFEAITHINNELLNANEQTIVSLVQENTPTTLTLVNIATGKIRDIQITPARWQGTGLLGMMIRYENMTNANVEVIHVLDVYPTSPAANAGLRPQEDYLLGTASLPFKGYNQLDYWLQAHDKTPSQVFVFNSKSYSVRLVTITPDSNFGRGSLGCDVASGYLHAIKLDPSREVSVDASILNQQPLNTVATDLPVTGLSPEIQHPQQESAASTQGQLPSQNYQQQPNSAPQPQYQQSASQYQQPSAYQQPQQQQYAPPQQSNQHPPNTSSQQQPAQYGSPSQQRPLYQSQHNFPTSSQTLTSGPFSIPSQVYRNSPRGSPRNSPRAAPAMPTSI